MIEIQNKYNQMRLELEAARDRNVSLELANEQKLQIIQDLELKFNEIKRQQIKSDDQIERKLQEIEKDNQKIVEDLNKLNSEKDQTIEEL